jgi:hypothetical protein
LSPGIPTLKNMASSAISAITASEERSALIRARAFSALDLVGRVARDVCLVERRLQVLNLGAGA